MVSVNLNTVPPPPSTDHTPITILLEYFLSLFSRKIFKFPYPNRFGVIFIYAFFNFNQEDNKLVVKSISEKNEKFGVGVVESPLDIINKPFEIVLGVKELMGLVKNVKSEGIEILIPENLKNIKMVCSGDKNFWGWIRVNSLCLIDFKRRNYIIFGFY